MKRTKHGLARVEEMFFALCKGLDTPRSLKAHLLFKYKEWAQLATFEVHPTEYNDPYSFADDYLVSSFLKKNADLPAVADTRAEAIRRFKVAESKCRETNIRMKAWVSGEIQPPDHVSRVLWRAREKTLGLLSKFRPSASMCSWGNGATDDMSRPKAYIDHKLTHLPISVTPHAGRHGLGAIVDDLHWSSAIAEVNPKGGKLLAYTQGNIFDTVRKTVLTDRSIGKEPRLNGFLQKGAGLQLRYLLREVGVDLNDQTHNQVLASLAVHLDLATLDLSMASDCLATEVVSYFCPIDVFVYLNEIRSHCTLIEGSWLKLEKFSSMGNGFTFELESLIYWGLALACSEELGYTTFGVYGDDIIVHQRVAPLITECLQFIGFDLNTSKSFTEGYFYESCGKHYFDGVDVTPVYQKSCPSTPEEALRMANRIFRAANRRARGGRLDNRLLGAWRSVVRNYELAKYAGPPLLEGDGHLEVPLHELTTPYCRNRGYMTLRRLPVVKPLPGIASALYALKLRHYGSQVNDKAPHDIDSHRSRLDSFARRSDVLKRPMEGSGLRSDDVERRTTTCSDRRSWVSLAFAPVSLVW